jgi:hypothetical protein
VLLWCLGHDPLAQILCVSYAQDFADKLSRDCRHIVAGDWYRRIFPTRLSPQRAAMPEYDGARLPACHLGRRRAVRARRRPHYIDDPLKPEEALSQAQRRAANEWYDHTLYSRLNDNLAGAIGLIPLIRTSGANAVQSLNAAAGRAVGRGTRAGLAIWAKAYCGGTSRAYHASRRTYH